MAKAKTKKKRLVINVLFITTCLVVLTALFLAPDETTTRLPHDQEHELFHTMNSRKEADKLCITCHDQGKISPLPEDHPPPYRCLFCHKRDQ